MKIVNCPICMGLGFVMLRKDNYETKYHCICRFGEAHKYEGSECSKHATKYYCASIDALTSGIIDAVIADNQKRYGIKKVADRWMKPDEPVLTKEQIKEMRDMAWAYMKVKLEDPFVR